MLEHGFSSAADIDLRMFSPSVFFPFYSFLHLIGFIKRFSILLHVKGI